MFKLHMFKCVRKSQINVVHLLGQIAFTLPDILFESSRVMNVPISTQFSPSSPVINKSP